MLKGPKFFFALTLLALGLAGCGVPSGEQEAHATVEIQLDGGGAPLRTNGELSAAQRGQLLAARGGTLTFSDGTRAQWENRGGTAFFTDDAGAGPVAELPNHIRAYAARTGEARLTPQGAGAVRTTQCNFWFLWCWSSTTFDGRWPNATVPYGYAPGTPAKLKAEFERAARHWNTALQTYRDQHRPGGRFPRWVRDEGNPERVVVTFGDAGGDGSSAYGGESEFVGFGQNAGTQYLKINANPDFPRPLGLYLHEMGHVAGLIHEHQRCDRDEAVTINGAHAYPDRLNAFTPLCAARYGAYTPYDYESVMQYPKKAFSRDGKETITAKSGARAWGDPARMGEQRDLSAGDLTSLVEMYSR